MLRTLSDFFRARTMQITPTAAALICFTTRDEDRTFDMLNRPKMLHNTFDAQAKKKTRLQTRFQEKKLYLHDGIKPSAMHTRRFFLR